MSGATARSAPAVVSENFRRVIVSRGVDARGPYAILECAHKIRKHTEDLADTHRWCNSCANRSPYR